MLDFTSVSVAESLADQAASEPSRPLSDAALLDAYSDAVVAVTEQVGPAVVRVENQRDGQRLGRTITIAVLRLGRLREFAVLPLERKG